MFGIKIRNTGSCTDSWHTCHGKVALYATRKEAEKAIRERKTQQNQIGRFNHYRAEECWIEEYC